jgi:hypothetical protein
MRKLLLVVIAVLALATTAFAATKNGITPKTPKQGSTVKVGTRPLFTGKVSGKGVIYIHVSESKKTDSKGVIGSDATIQKAKRKSNGTFSMKADFFDFPQFWLNSPDTYYWQAHRIACEGGNTSDCLQEGPIVKFKVG